MVVNDKELANNLDPTGKIVTPSVIRKWRLAGGLPFFQVGKRIFFNTESVNQWMKDRENENKKQDEMQCGQLRRIL